MEEVKKKRTPIVAANWKMNKTCAETVSFLSKLLYFLEDLEGDVEVLVFPPFTALRSATTFLESGQQAKGIFPEIGAQNMHWKLPVLTPEKFPPYAERVWNQVCDTRAFREKKDFQGIQRSYPEKVRAALENDLIPLICVGETLEEREEERTEEVIKEQLLDILYYFREKQPSNFVIAYEPVWAIGTGVAATPEVANDACRFIRALVGSVLSPETAAQIRILYGGSVDPSNFREYLLEPEIDGGLVGTASLHVEKFAELIKTALNYG